MNLDKIMGSEKSFKPRVDPRLARVSSLQRSRTMQTAISVVSTGSHDTSTRSRWVGRVLSGLPVVFLTLDAVMKLIHPSFVTEASARIGFPDRVNPSLGVLLLACLGLYVVPRTSPLGAVLLTGYLGGAVAIHIRIEDPLFSHVLMPVYVGVLVWAGLYLRDARVRAAIS
jgi:hypothetical protein